METVKVVVCIGAGYVGGPTMAVMAKHCAEVTFYIVDVNEQRIGFFFLIFFFSFLFLVCLLIYQSDGLTSICLIFFVFFSSLRGKRLMGVM